MNFDDNILTSLALTTEICCCFCHEKIANVFMLDHLFLHLNDYPYKCGHSNCCSEFPTERLLETHSRIKHGSKIKIVYAVDWPRKSKWMDKVYSTYCSKNFPAMLSNGASLLVDRIESLMEKSASSKLSSMLQRKIDFNDIDKDEIVEHVYCNRNIEPCALSSVAERKLDFCYKDNIGVAADTNQNNERKFRTCIAVKRKSSRFIKKRKPLIKCGHCNSSLRSRQWIISCHIMKHLREENKDVWAAKCQLCDHSSIYKFHLINHHLKQIHDVINAEEGLHYVDKSKEYRSVIAAKRSLWFPGKRFF